MAADLTRWNRDARTARLIAATLAATIGPWRVSSADVPSGETPHGSPVFFYSTAAPPADYPGPSPEPGAPAPEADPFAGALALAPTEGDATTPAETPPPAVEATADAVERASGERAEPDAAPEPDPMRLASGAAADRVPGPIEAVPAPEASSAEAAPISYAMAALRASKDRYEAIQDYTCTFIKRERINGRLSGFEVMTMKARTSPRSVYFKFKQPNAGREAIHVHGRNGGKAIVHDVGIGRFLAGTLHLDPLGRRAMDGNRHPITEAGIGFLIDTLLDGWRREMTPLESVVTIREGVLVNKRPSTLITCRHPRREPHFVFHEVRLYIDRELGLPVRFEAYDFPSRPGEAAPLVEEYTYADLRVDVGLTDHDFDPSNKAYSFGRF